MVLDDNFPTDRRWADQGEKRKRDLFGTIDATENRAGETIDATENRAGETFDNTKATWRKVFDGESLPLLLRRDPVSLFPVS